MKIIIFIIFISIGLMEKIDNNTPYKNPSLPIEVRLDDLISRMTVEEKIGQLRVTLAWNYYIRKGDNVILSEQFKKDILEQHIGMLWGVYRADPWTEKSLINGLNPKLAAKFSNLMQKYIMENTRLGIPLFLAEEAPHGHMAIGTTVFPTGLGMAATFSTSLMEKVGKIISKEIRLQGAHISYGPVMDLTRDPRWSRVEESFGEDPILSGEMASAEICGLGGGDLSKPYSTLATPKHFVGYGTTEGGHNSRPTFIGKRELLEQFLPPFYKVINSGALSVMASYNSIDGIPITCDDWLLKDILRDEWKFRGFVVSDLYSINGIWNNHYVVGSLEEAGIAAIKAGVDADLGALAYENLIKSLKKGKISMNDIDNSVRRILRMKFEMGLFENPYVDENQVYNIRSEEHKKVAFDVARASITLLKNNGILPLNKNQKIAVIGPNANNTYNLLGDYTAPQDEGNVKTILYGIQQKVKNVEYVKGCSIRDMNNSNIDEAVEVAIKSDIIVVAVGGSSARDFKTSYQDTGAAQTDDNDISDMDCGEGFDRATLDLLGRQNELLEELKKTNKPMVVIYIEGRPLNKLWASENVDAILTAYYPGQEGGLAIADVLFGDYNPAGRLPVSVPRYVGQIPVYYNQKYPQLLDYMDMSGKPLYSFGYGLSYTDFKYDNLIIKKNNINKNILICFDITNIGKRDGEEVPQLYIHDKIASTVQPMKQLKKFTRIMIHANETKTITFSLNYDDFSIINKDMKRVVEPGVFEIMIGKSSDNIVLKDEFEMKI